MEGSPDTQLAGRRGAFPALVVAEFVSITGSEISALAVPWFVLVTTGSPARTGLALAAEFVGMLVFGVPAGEVVARLGARRTMLLADAVRGCLIAAIPILHSANALSFPALLSILLAVGAVFPAHSSAGQLVLATVVGQDQIRLTRANGIMGSLNEAGSLMGPALGGVLIALTSAPAVLLIDAATYAVAFAMTMAVVRPGRVAAVEGEAPDSGRLLAGFRFLVSDRWLPSISIGVAVMEVTWTGMMAALPVLAFRAFDRNVYLAGWFIGAFGGGSMIGGLLSAKVVRRFGIGRVAVGAYAVEAAAMWVLVTSPPPGGVIAAVAVDGLCMGIFMPALFAEMTVRTPAALRGKTLAAANVAFSVGGPLGFIGVGFLLQHVTGTAPAFLAIASVATIAAVFATAPQASV